MIVGTDYLEVEFLQKMTSESEDRGTAVRKRSTHVRFSCNFDIYPGKVDTFPERLHKERVLLYKFHKSMDGLHVRFVAAVINNQYPSVFVRYSRDNWASQTDIELTSCGSFADGCFYDGVVPLYAMMPSEYDAVQFRVGCSDGRLVKFDNNGGATYEVRRLPTDANNNSFTAEPQRDM